MKLKKTFTEDAAKRAADGELLETGDYDGVLLAVKDDQSKVGNDMLVPTIGIGNREIMDWLTESERSALRFRHLCSSCGILDKYEAGSVSAADFVIGTPIRVRIGVQKGTRSYPRPKNIIEDYYAPATAARVVNLREAG